MMSDEPNDSSRRASRLQPVEPRTIEPFFRSDQVTEQSLYWLPVSGFPLSWRERHWLLTFVTRLRNLLTSGNDWKLGTFLQAKALTRENTDLFLARKLDYTPFSGIALRPGTGMPAAPSNDAVRKEIEDNAYNVDVSQWMPDFCYWLLTGDDEEQRFNFLGTGHMSFLFTAPDKTATTPPKLFAPRILRTHPAMKDGKLEQQMKITEAMQRPFMKRSKELFGSGIRDHHAYDGIPFVFPMLTSADLIAALPEDLAQWFELFGAYFTESPADKGCLLAVADPEFDEPLSDLLKQMRDEGEVYS